MERFEDERDAVEKRPRRAIVWMAVTYWCVWVVFTHWPKIELPVISNIRLDKVGHFGGYSVLAFLLAMLVAIYWRGGLRLTRRDAVGVWLVIAVGGILDEWTQPYFGRSFEWGDYAADLLGGLCGLAIAAAVLSYRRSLHRAAAASS
ncbi:MAG: VanZ family protein [Planctomycetaceae bacterium]|nr:VanZ family protein [Planctomycetaceae bacterium]